MIGYGGSLFKTLDDPIHVGNKLIGKVMVGMEQVYPDLPQYHARYAQWIMFSEIISNYGSDPVDQYGALLRVNDDAVVTKCSIYLQLNSDGTLYRRRFGIRGTNITEVRYVPFLAYKGSIVYDGDNSSGINTFDLTENSAGYYETTDINPDLESSGGERISNYSISYDSENVKIVYSLDDFVSYLSTD